MCVKADMSSEFLDLCRRTAVGGKALRKTGAGMENGRYILSQGWISWPRAVQALLLNNVYVPLNAILMSRIISIAPANRNSAVPAMTGTSVTRC
jgi:hypothetical protein